MWLRGYESLRRDSSSWKCALTVFSRYSTQSLTWKMMRHWIIKSSLVNVFFSVIISIFSVITRGRTWSTDKGDVIDGYVSCLSSRRSLQNHLVDFLQGHMDLHQQPLIPLISWFLPHLQERQEADSLVTMRMWGGFCNTMVYTETATIQYNALCYFAISISQLCEKYSNREKTQLEQSQTFLNQPQSCFSNIVVRGSNVSRLNH